MIFQLAAAADDEALFGHFEPVERAARQLELLKDGDLLAGHLAVTDQERRTGKRRKTGADKPRRLVLYAFRLSRPREGFVVSAAIVQSALGRVEMWRGGGRLNISVCRLFRLAVP